MAGLLGIVSGLWNVGAYLLACHGSACTAPSSAPPGFEGVILAVLGVILVIDSVIALVGPGFVFYSTAVLALSIDAVEVLWNSSVTTGTLYITLGLTSLSAALSLAATFRKSGVSEQSHPMNLPVFG